MFENFKISNERIKLIVCCIAGGLFAIGLNILSDYKYPSCPNCQQKLYNPKAFICAKCKAIIIKNKP